MPERASLAVGIRHLFIFLSALRRSGQEVGHPHQGWQEPKLLFFFFFSFLFFCDRVSGNP